MERIESLVSSQIGPSSEPARSSLRVVSSAQPAISSSIKKATSDAWTYTDELPRVPTQQPTQNQYIDEILATYKVLPVRSRSTSPRPSSTEIISQQGVTTRVSSLAKAVDIGTEAPQRPFVTVSGPRVHLDPLPTALSSTEAQTVPVNDNTDKMLTFMQELLARQQEALASSAELAQAMVTHAISRGKHSVATHNQYVHKYIYIYLYSQKRARKLAWRVNWKCGESNGRCRSLV